MRLILFVLVCGILGSQTAYAKRSFSFYQVTDPYDPFPYVFFSGGVSKVNSDHELKSIYLGIGYNPIVAVGLYGGDSTGRSTGSKFHTQGAFLRKDIWLEDSRLWSLYLQVDYGKLEHESSYGSEPFWTREAGGHIGVLFIQGFHLSYTYRRRNINENRILVEDYFIDREYHTYTAGVSLYWNLETLQMIFP